jgi:hypothetical protein
VAYDPAIGSLLLACKHSAVEAGQGRAADLPLEARAGDSGRLSMLTVPLDQADRIQWVEGDPPSDITIDPFTGNYVLIASPAAGPHRDHTRRGWCCKAGCFPACTDMAEGIAITKDSILIISDEAVKRPAVVTLSSLALIDPPDPGMSAHEVLAQPRNSWPSPPAATGGADRSSAQRGPGATGGCPGARLSATRAPSFTARPGLHLPGPLGPRRSSAVLELDRYAGG